MNDSLLDVLKSLDNMSDYCEGATMVAKDGDYLHNFACCIQHKIRRIIDKIEKIQVGEE